MSAEPAGAAKEWNQKFSLKMFKYCFPFRDSNDFALSRKSETKVNCQCSGNGSCDGPQENIAGEGRKVLARYWQKRYYILVQSCVNHWLQQYMMKALQCK